MLDEAGKLLNDALHLIMQATYGTAAQDEANRTLYNLQTIRDSELGVLARLIWPVESQP